MLVDHARNELERAGLFMEDSEYNGMIGSCVMELIKVFAAQGHSGGSAYVTLGIFNDLAKFTALSEITDEPETWHEVCHGLWQNTRDSALFSHNGGKTYYNVADTPRVMLTASEAK